MRDKQFINEWRAWKVCNPTFPLTVHASGKWSKKIDGKTHYFGSLDDPLAAELQYNMYMTGRPEKREPRFDMENANVYTLLEHHRLCMEDDVAAGRIAEGTLKAYSQLPAILNSAGLLRKKVTDLGPGEFGKVQAVLDKSSRRPRTQKNIIMLVRTVFNWGVQMGLIEPVKYGPMFKPPSSIDIEAEQEENGAFRFLDAGIIRKLLYEADSHVHIAILLGINCGFYQSDSVVLQLKHLHQEGDIVYHNFRRVKNKRPRMAVLWPETVEAIDEHCADRCGCYKEDYILKEGGMSSCRLSLEFDRLASRVAPLAKGVGLGSLRHTYATVIDTVADQSMIDLTLGHASTSLQKRAYKQVNLDELERLKKVADVAHKWLFG